jgi:hypothetical protein
MRFVYSTCILFMVAMLLGCGSSLRTNPTGRSASDQMLVASTMRDAVDSLDIDHQLKDKVVELDIQGLGNDQVYLVELFKAKIRLAGGKVAGGDASPEIKLVVLVQMAGSDNEAAGWSIPIIFPSVGNGLTTTKIDIYSNNLQVGRCRMWAYGLDMSDTVVFEHPPVYAAHYISNPELIGISLGKRTDIPELRSKTGTTLNDLVQ